MTGAIGLILTLLTPNLHSRDVWTLAELYLIYSGVIRKQLLSVTFQVRGLLWQSNMSKGASAT